MQEKAIKVIIIAALTVMFFAHVAMPVHALDILVHANWAHLAINAITLWGIPMPRRVLLVAVPLGMLGIAVSSAAGFSAVLCAAIGLQWHRFDCRRNRWSMGIFFALSAVIPQLAFTAHALPFALGLLIDFLCCFYKRYNHDTRH